ncbi:uncharacterized protein AB9X84_015386 [Acanthopagrus schlegelii]
MVQDRLLKVDGVVRNYRLYATVGGTEIQVDANMRNRLWKQRQVSFYLGFTIRGPVAFGIHTKTAEKAKIPETDIAKSWQIKPELSPCTDTLRGPSGGLKPGGYCLEKDSSDWTKLEPKVNKEDEVRIYYPLFSSVTTASGQHFVERHRTALIDRVSDTGHILDKLLEKKLISQEVCVTIRGLSTTYEQMMNIIDLMVKVGTTGKDALYEILRRMRSMRPLISELEESG